MKLRRSNLHFWFINEYAGSPFHGQGTRHYYLARELVKKGHQVTIISAAFSHLLNKLPKIEGKYTFEEINCVNYLWINVPRYKHAHDKKRIFKSFVFSFRLLSMPLYRFERPYAIMVSSPELLPVYPSYWLAKKLRAKLVFEVRDIWPLTLVELGSYSRFHPYILFLQMLENFAYRKAEVVISLLPNALEHMKSHGCAEEKFHYIPNGISLEEMELTEPLDDEVKKMIPKGKFLVGYAGAIGLANALEHLLRVANLLKDERDIHFLIVGEGNDKERLKGICQERGLSNVTFIPAIPKRQVQPLLKEFDVCYIGLLDSPLFRFGVSPNKLFDYFYAGKPIVYAVNSSNKPVDEARAGISVPAGNPEAIAEAIIKIKSLAPEERKMMGLRGREYVIANHNYEILADKFLQSFCI